MRGRCVRVDDVGGVGGRGTEDPRAPGVQGEVRR